MPRAHTVSAKSSATPKLRRSVGQAGRRPRTRSMSASESPAEPMILSTSPAKEGGASGSEANNQAGGSPSSNESSPVERKKPRHSGLCEITEAAEKEPLRAATPESSPTQAESQDEGERVVYYFTEYMCLSLWRAIERYEIWDHGLIKAFRQGPSIFAEKVNRLATSLQYKLRGSDTRGVAAEDVALSFVDSLRPKGLLDCCARILRLKTNTTPQNTLKRKTADLEESDLQSSIDDSRKFKHRFYMEKPRLKLLKKKDSGGYDFVEVKYDE